MFHSRFCRGRAVSSICETTWCTPIIAREGRIHCRRSLTATTASALATALAVSRNTSKKPKPFGDFGVSLKEVFQLLRSLCCIHRQLQ